MPYSSRFYRRLPTEQPNPASRGLDAKSVEEIVRIINAEDAKVPAAVAAQRRKIVQAVEILAEALENGGRVVFAGAGTSGRLGVMEAAECPPTFGTTPSQVRALMAGGRSSVFRAREGAEDDPRDGARRLAKAARKGDAVVGIAASGITPFVRGALAQARRLGCRTILVTSNFRAKAPEAEIVIAPQIGPEVLCGSTRMKSGTAAKLVLNTLTTAAMIRIGKAYRNWMVDLRPTSYKLRQRAVRMVCELGRVGPARGRRLFDEAGSSVKTAVVMARLGLGASEARERLRASGGWLRRALAVGALE
ncbi:MAG: N-acetylmuramic acid 6-phosphate etherase [Elusimicrobia bacterium]|nr:N-acetylmuramic acid 6-phosphate etherase [Elusimicrobiota bacterium]